MTRARDSVDTVNAAAIVLAAAAAAQSTRGRQPEEQHVGVTKKKWWSCLRAHLCFRPPGDGSRRIADASLSMEPAPHGAPASPTTAASSSSHHHHPPAPALPFAAPPSSPASSLLTSEAPSPAAAPLTLSPPGPRSIFAFGPYADEPQQLVSPPVFSTFTTEPSTAPLTPPPECPSLHPTTNPSSPEVPFARLLMSSFNATEHHCGSEFQAYQLHPGSPIGCQLVSPGSVCSSSSSPPLFRAAVKPPPRILGPEEIASRKLHQRWRARNNDGSLLDGQVTAAPEPICEHASHRVPLEMADGASVGGSKLWVDETYHDLPNSNEFVFGRAEGGSGGNATAAETNVASDWFAGDAGGPTDADGRKNWPFFPMVEHGN